MERYFALVQVNRWYDKRYEINPLLPMPVLRQMIANQAAEAQRRYDDFFSKPGPERSRRNDWRN